MSDRAMSSSSKKAEYKSREKRKTIHADQGGVKGDKKPEEEKKEINVGSAYKRRTECVIIPRTGKKGWLKRGKKDGMGGNSAPRTTCMHGLLTCLPPILFLDLPA
jgi:hypothetical protein